jgi:predicted nuclease of predicted toxin-antitoxin system
MRFIFDQSTDRRLAPVLRQWGHEVTVVAADYPASLPDDEVLAIAYREQRILVTEDRDFGELVFRHRLPHSGVVYLRLPPMGLVTKISHLTRLLEEHPGRFDQFLVVSERGVRIRLTP